jgi:hypothetical protein
MNNGTSNIPDLSVKSSLAKLLAKENIQVQTGNHRTASFDPVSRVLFLPLFKKESFSKDAMDMFIGHEVSHALYTPQDSIENLKNQYSHIPFSLFNIVEDIRIERLIQKAYPGLMINFRKGYQELIDRDFFQIKGKDLNEVGLANRLNIHAKIGNLVNVPMNTKEREFFSKCYAAESFDEVIKLTVELYDGIQNDSFKEEEEDTSSSGDGDKQEEQQQSGLESNSDDQDEGKESSDDSLNVEDEEGDETVTSQSDEGDDSKEDGQKTQTDGSQVSTNGASSNKESHRKNPDLDTSTLDSVEDSFRNQTEDLNVNILSVPTREEFDAAFVSFKELAKYREEYKNSDLYKNSFEGSDLVKEQKILFKQFMVDSRKYVSNLVNEFNRKKSASLYSRSTTAKVGSLDTTRIHAYKYSEDIFKSVSVTPEDKNHGMIMFVDMSASMQYQINSVIRQVIQLSLFCRQVGIPFDVYGFNTSSLYDSNNEKQSQRHSLNYVKHTEYHLYYDFLNILHLLSSDQKKQDFEIAIEEIFNYGSDHFIPPVERLSGTPLLETIVAAHTIVNDFKKKNKVEKLNMIVLSDGEGGLMNYNLSPNTKEFHARKTFVLNGRQVSPKSSCFSEWYQVLLENLKETTGCNIIGYYLMKSNKNLIQNKFGYVLNKDKIKQLIDDGSMNIGSYKGFSSYFILTNEGITYDDDEDLGDLKISGSIMSRSNIKKIANVFGKHMESYKNSRVFLREFSSIIA